MVHQRRLIATEDVLNIFDNNRLWYYIPSFDGYEVSNDGYIRSMKHYRKYPYGIIIKPVSREPYKGSCDPLYELSDSDNKRQRIRLSQIMLLAANNQFAVRGYPRLTIISNNSGRNKFVKNSDGAYVKVYNGPTRTKKLNIPPMDQTARYAKFTIIQDGTEALGMSYQQPTYTVPIESIKGNEYYGRKDCRVIYDPGLKPAEELSVDNYYGQSFQ